MKRKYISFGLLLILFTGIILSCRKSDKGDPGPVGAQGSTGASGSNLPGYKSGSINGTYSGTTAGGNAMAIPFNYQFFKESLENSVYTDANLNNNYQITRYDTLGESYIALSFYVDGKGVFYGNSVTIKSINKSTNNSFLYFGTGTTTTPTSINLGSYYTYGQSAITFSNTSVNTTTGAVSFDYSIELWTGHNTTGNIATITGSINATPYTETMRLPSAK
jgi:hypothetical protein